METVDYNSFTDAVQQGNTAQALEILKSPEVLSALVQQATENNNHPLAMVAGYDNYELLVQLLLIPEVRANAAADNNYALRLFVAHSNLAAVELLLAIPEVLENIAVDNLYVLHRACSNTDLAMVKRLIKEPAVSSHIDGIKGALKLAHKAESKMICYELRKLLGEAGFSIMQPRWRRKLREDFRDVLNSKLALAQVYKDLNGLSGRNAYNPLFSLPQEIWRKIAEYNTPRESKLIQDKNLTALHMFVTRPNYADLLDEALDSVKAIEASKISLRG